jgi:FdhD protein
METREYEVVVYENGVYKKHNDTLAVEAPLEVRIKGRTEFFCMRLPGMDRELAAGLCFNSGLVKSPDDIKGVSVIGENTADVEAEITGESGREEIRIIRSSSGVIPGRVSAGTEEVSGYGKEPLFTGNVLFKLQNDFFSRQKVFDSTGATHAAGLYDVNGSLLVFAEDVGRHNALDKCAGYLILNGKYGEGFFCILSSRLSYEMVMKGVRAGASVIAGVSAPTSLAVNMARESGITLAGFLRKNRFNIYSGDWRISKDLAGQ